MEKIRLIFQFLTGGKLKLCLILFILGLVSAAFLHPQKALAWDTNSIISDISFTNKSSMSEADIQSFLESKQGYLANYYEERNLYVGPNNDINTRGWRASKIIYSASQWYNMNPRTVLVTLQKEQSLVTTSWRNQYGIDWAMGYAVTDSGVVSACRTALNPGGSCIGFSTQVDWGTYQLRYNFDKANEKSDRVWPYVVGNTLNIDGINVYLSNAATASLYRYTPHLHGNENFQLIFSQWFGMNENPLSIFTLSPLSLSNSSPARGETLTASFSLTNNIGTSITVDAVGIIGRYGAYNGPNRDMGWQGPITFNLGETKLFSFSRTITESGTQYYWAGINYQGIYIQYNQWGKIVVAHEPNLSIPRPISVSPTPIYLGQKTTFSTVIRNNEPNPIKYDALGLPVRLNGYNLDAVWLSQGTLNPYQEVTISGFRTMDSVGKASFWASYVLNGYYSNIGGINSKEVYINLGSVSTLLTVSDYNPIIGETLKATYAIVNNLATSITIDQIGVIGRYGDYNGANRDMGWNGPITLQPRKKISQSFSRKITDLGPQYYWAGVYYKGEYLQYKQWGAAVNARNLDLGRIQTSIMGINKNPSLGQTITATYTLYNPLSTDITLDQIGVIGRAGSFTGTNRDMGWQGPVTIPAGQSITRTFSRVVTDPGVQYYWAGIYQGGQYLQYKQWGTTVNAN